MLSVLGVSLEDVQPSLSLQVGGIQLNLVRQLVLRCNLQ